MIIDAVTHAVDTQRTEALRAELQTQRGDVWWTYDRGDTWEKA